MSVSKEQKRRALETYFADNRERAEKIASDPDKIKKLLQELEEKLSSIPSLGPALYHLRSDMLYSAH